MNKQLLFAALFIFATFAQGFSQGLMVGPITGLNDYHYKISYVDTDNEPYFSTSGKVGFHIGVVADYQFGGRFGIEPAIIFSQKGNKLEFIRPNNAALKFNYTSTHTITTIDVPLLLKYKFGTPERGLALMAGPSLNFAIGGRYTESGVAEGTLYDNAGSPYQGTFKYNESDKPVRIGDKVNSNYKGFEIGFTFGIGGYFEIGESGKLIIEARYTLSSTNILNTKYISGETQKATGANAYTITGYNIINDSELISSVQNRGFQLSLGYLFDLQ
jgi:hypothetical protein